MLEFGLLGPVEVHDDGVPIAIGAAKLRGLLAALLLKPNRTVPTETLIERVWAERPPLRAVATLQNYVLRLRQALGGHGAVIRTAVGGYLIAITAEQLDLSRFELLTAEAERATDPAETSRLLAEALALWRGPALMGITSEPLLREEGARMEEMRLNAVERRIDAELTLGRHLALVPELRALTAEHPWREQFWRQLMVALNRSGRRAEALATYRQVSQLLSEELGLDPGPELREQHAAILTGGN
ncbi:AfsR/SARP family transcriptional regulator [Streptoalloteichus hindustanus]|uniref:DNA-binding transcriptional activator of the SARP family n=1 Tax=Streptoalloteichus hindustanus TaxID=2017 RepID=A0A1M5MUS7_STRHI|nr:AfsR/SARP family transcriptional regulator [Streptoalloteichus hindustanus]SHG80965.1 DNA-binding transcriptional activator of the SARP family [Streptoalloteichus hindustanus]